MNLAVLRVHAVLHQFGHALGIGHAQGSSTVQARINVAVIKVHKQQETVHAVQQLQPTNALVHWLTGCVVNNRVSSGAVSWCAWQFQDLAG